MDLIRKARRGTQSLGALLLAALLVVASTTPPLYAQSEVAVDPLLVAFDDPTLLARAIDQRVGREVAECMQGEGFEYAVAPDARFDLQKIDVTDVLVPKFDSFLRELVPRVVDPEVLESAFIEPGVIEFQPNLIAPFNPDLLDAPLLQAQPVPEFPVEVDPRFTDPGLRLQPSVEGYGVGFPSFEIVEVNPNIEIVRDLSPVRLAEYEEAFYGIRLDEVEFDTVIGGCAERIDSILVDEIIPLLRELDRQLETFKNEIETSSEFNNALVEWSECLSATPFGEGLALQSPDEAVRLATDRFEALGEGDESGIEDAREFETALAEADYGCRARTTDLAIASVMLRSGGDIAVQTLDVAAELAEVTP